MPAARRSRHASDAPVSTANGDSLGFRVWWHHGHVMPAGHAHSDLEINLLSTGSMRYFIAGRFVTVLPGHLAVFWAGMPHQLVVCEDDPSGWWMTVPIAEFLRWNLGSGMTGRLLTGELVTGRTEVADDDRHLLARWRDDLASDDEQLRQAARLEVEARFRRLAACTQPSPAPKTMALPDASQKQVELIAAYIGAHYQGDCPTSAVARAVGLNPTYAMTVFKRGCGMSMHRYITLLRLSHAQRLLLTTEQTALAIAMASGFGSLARFYAAFQKHCGEAPGHFRKHGHG